MTLEIQNYIILAVCSVSVLYLIIRYLNKRKLKDACSKCPAMKLTKQN